MKSNQIWIYLYVYIGVVTTLTNFIFLDEFVMRRDVKRCTNLSSKYILNIRVSMEESAASSLAMFMGYEPSAPESLNLSAERYFSTIFEEINHGLLNYGIQIRADFSDLNFESFHISLNKKECINGECVSLFTKHISKTLMGPVGNVICVFGCEMDPDIDYDFLHVERVGGCGHVGGVLYHHPDLMARSISLQVLRMISNNDNIKVLKMNDFEKDVCAYARTCIGTSANFLGEYASAWRHVRDVTHDQFYLQNSVQYLADCAADYPLGLVS